MAKKTVKKVDVKKVAKMKVMEIVCEALEAAGIPVLDGEDYGDTAGTIIARTEKCDVKIRPITPKAGLERYERLEEEEAAE